MRRDTIISIFLFYVLFALLFVVLFPVYFSYGQIFYRSVSVVERMMSVIFVLLWLTLCAFTAYLKKLTCFFGGVLFSFLAYLPEIVIPRLSTAVPGSDPNLFTSILDGAMRRLYELINAPMAGVSVLFPPEKALGISKWMLPVLVISYIATQIFRFYRNAYLADQLLLTDAPAGEAALPPSEAAESSPPRIKDRIATFIAKMKTPIKEKIADEDTLETETSAQENFRETEAPGPIDFQETEEGVGEDFLEESDDQTEQIQTPADERDFDISLSDLEAEAESLPEKEFDTDADDSGSDSDEKKK